MRSTAKRHLPSRRTRQRGIALMLVIAVIGLASVMSVALLASSSLQAQVKSASVRAADAQYLAESGVNLGLYYLQRPDVAPLLNGDGYYPGQTGVSFGSAVDGTADISIAAVNGLSSTYDVSATAHAGADANNQTTRSLTVRAYVPNTYQVKHAVSILGDFSEPATMTINGDVRDDATLMQYGTVSGSIFASGSNVAFSQLPAMPVYACPAIADLNLYQTLAAATPYYTYTDASGTVHTGTPQLVPTNPVSGTLTPAATNPMGVWYSDGNLQLNDCTINGTLFLRSLSKRLTIAGNARITAMSGMPALLVNGNIIWPGNATAKSLTVDGLFWTSGIFISSGGTATNCSTVVNGALMLANGAPQIHPTYSGTITVNYIANNVALPDLSAVGKVPQSVKIVQWGS